MFIKNETNAPIRDIIEGNEIIINPNSDLEINNTFGKMLLKKYGFLKVVSTEEIKPIKNEEVKTSKIENNTSVKKSRKGKKYETKN